MDRTQQPEPNRAIRLLIEYDQSRFTVRESWSLETLAPPSHPLVAAQAQSGFWFELRDGKDSVVYRRVMENPVQFDVEVHDPERGPYRRAVEEPKGVFTILIPDLPEAQEIVFVSSPLDPAESAGPAEQVARLTLR